MCLPCLLVQKVTVSFYGDIEIIVIIVANLTNYLSTVSIDSLYSTLKVISKPFDINEKKAAFQDNKS